jgi:hypothetical protein
MTVFENMCVLFIQARGASGPWQDRSNPNPILGEKIKNKDSSTNHVDQEQKTSQPAVSSLAFAGSLQGLSSFPYAIKAPPFRIRLSDWDKPYSNHHHYYYNIF